MAEENFNANYDINWGALVSLVLVVLVAASLVFLIIVNAPSFEQQPTVNQGVEKFSMESCLAGLDKNSSTFKRLVLEKHLDLSNSSSTLWETSYTGYPINPRGGINSSLRGEITMMAAYTGGGLEGCAVLEHIKDSTPPPYRNVLDCENGITVSYESEHGGNFQNFYYVITDLERNVSKKAVYTYDPNKVSIGPNTVIRSAMLALSGNIDNCQKRA